MNPGIFRQYDIRGVVGPDLDSETAYHIGRAFALLIRTDKPSARQVSVGRDVRLSSEELAGALISGMADSGLSVVDIGICPTPLQYFSIRHLGLDGGIMVTGSHNPPEYNGMKLSIGGETIHGETIQRLRRMVEDGPCPPVSEIGSVTSYDICTAYENRMRQEFSHLSEEPYRRLKVVVDSGNGTAGLLVPSLLQSAGCDVIPLYCEPDGRFPNHHPDPTVVEYIQDLIRTTREECADFGVAYDGDADRIGLVDSDGNVIWGDQFMIVLSRDILGRIPGSRIIGDVKCSQVMFDDVQAHGGVPIMWKTGHSLIKQKMRDEQALLAGEFSGHIFIADGYYGYDDAIYATLRLVDILKRTGRDLKGLLADIPHMHYTPEIRMDCPDEEKMQVVKAVVKRFLDYRDQGGCAYPIRDVSTLDGVRVVFDKGWGLVRVSNTQPVIVMRFEATDEDSLNNYRKLIEKEIKRAVEVQ